MLPVYMQEDAKESNGAPLVIGTRQTDQGMCITGDAVDRFDAQVPKGGEHSIPLPEHSVLKLPDGEVAATQIVLHRQGTRLFLVQALTQKGPMTFGAHTPAAASPAAAETKKEPEKATPTVMISIGKDGSFQSAVSLQTFLQSPDGAAHRKELLTIGSTMISVNGSSSLTVEGAEPVPVSRLMIERSGKGFRVSQAAFGARFVFGNKTPGAEKKSEGKEKVSAVPQGPYLPSVQVPAVMESELNNRLKFAQWVAGKRIAEKKKEAEKKDGDKKPATKAEGSTVVEEVAKTHWTTVTLDSIEQVAKQLRANAGTPGYAPREARIASSVRKNPTTSQWLLSFLEREFLEKNIDPKNPSVTASFMVEAMESGTMGGKRISPELRGAIFSFLEDTASGNELGHEGVTSSPSSSLQRYAEFALGHYEFAGVKDEKVIGVTDKSVNWKQVATMLKAGETKRIIQEGAFRDVLDHAEKAAERAARAKDNDKSDQEMRADILEAMRLARETDFYRALPPAEKQAADEKFRGATHRLATRDSTVNTNWLSTEGANRAKSGRPVTGKGLKG
jgi:hypothetical protein